MTFHSTKINIRVLFWILWILWKILKEIKWFKMPPPNPLQYLHKVFHFYFNTWMIFESFRIHTPFAESQCVAWFFGVNPTPSRLRERDPWSKRGVSRTPQKQLNIYMPYAINTNFTTSQWRANNLRGPRQKKLRPFIKIMKKKRKIFNSCFSNFDFEVSTFFIQRYDL